MVVRSCRATALSNSMQVYWESCEARARPRTKLRLPEAWVSQNWLTSTKELQSLGDGKVDLSRLAFAVFPKFG